MSLTKTIQLFSLFALFSILLNACNSPTIPERPKYKPDVSSFKADVTVYRFEKDLQNIDTTNISEGIEKLKEKYGDFAETFLQQIIARGANIDVPKALKGFLTIPVFKDLADTIQIVYPDFDEEEAQIEEMLRYAEYYFNDEYKPQKVYTYLSLFNLGAGIGEDYFGVGLDFFLGEDYFAYQAVENLRHQYIRRTLTPEYLVPTLTESLAQDVVDSQVKMGGNKMIDHMLFQGKKFFIKASLLPEMPDSLIYSFSNFQVMYCSRGETALWKHLGEEGLLYSSDFNKFKKYVTVGPFNPQNDLPGNSGSWLGTQIIMQYARRLRRQMQQSNPNLSPRQVDQKVLQNVLNEQDPQKFISQYKPIG